MCDPRLMVTDILTCKCVRYFILYRGTLLCILFSSYVVYPAREKGKKKTVWLSRKKIILSMLLFIHSKPPTSRCRLRTDIRIYFMNVYILFIYKRQGLFCSGLPKIFFFVTTIAPCQEVVVLLSVNIYQEVVRSGAGRMWCSLEYTTI